MAIAFKRFLARRLPCICAATFLTATVTCVPACAAPLELFAASTRPAVVSDFEIIFDDTVGDRLLRFGEVRFFSGVGFPPAGPGALLEPYLLGIPTIAGISVGNDVAWVFSLFPGGPPTATADLTLWTYRLDTVAGAPEPRTVWLLCIALVALALVRREKRRMWGRADVPV